MTEEQSKITLPSLSVLKLQEDAIQTSYLKFKVKLLTVHSKSFLIFNVKIPANLGLSS